MNTLRNLFYFLWFISISLILLKVGFILDFIVYRIEIQKWRADKIESFLEQKHKGEYSAKP